MKTIAITIMTFTLFSCGEFVPSTFPATDTIPTKDSTIVKVDSVKKIDSLSVPPLSGIHGSAGKDTTKHK